MKMIFTLKKFRHQFVTFLIFGLLCFQSQAQVVKVIDNKGTITEVNNNQVTTALTAPTTAVEGDIWFDTTTNTTKVWDATAVAWKRIDSWLGYKTTRHMSGTTLAITEALHNNTDIHIEGIGELSIASTAVTDATNFYITNTTGIARALSFSGFTGAYLRNGGTEVNLQGTGLVLKSNTRYLCHITKNGTNYYFNATEAVAADNLGNHTATQNIILGTGFGLTDTDGDTKIQVEEGSNDDTIRFDTAGQEEMTILPNGNVGIGTTTPTHALHINGGNNASISLSDTANTGDNVALRMYHGGTSGKGMGILWNDTVDTDGGLVIQGLSNTGAFVSNLHSFGRDGNVGIGTTTPTHKLSVTGEAIEIQNDNADSRIYFHNPGNAHWSAGLDQSNAHAFSINPGNFLTSAFFTIKTDGKVGIGTATPSAELDINGADSTSSGGLEIMHSNGTQGISFGFKGISKTGTNSESDLTLDGKATGDVLLNSIATGNVGIGVATPTSKLHVDGDVRITGAIKDSNNNAGTAGQILSSTVSGTEWVADASIKDWVNMTNGSATYYATNDLVSYNGVIYRNKTDANTDTTPDADAANWAQNTPSSVTNEMIFENTLYIYVSLAINGGWKVVRYLKSNFNVEATVTGTGTQPGDLGACEALTFP